MRAAAGSASRPERGGSALRTLRELIRSDEGGSEVHPLGALRLLRKPDDGAPGRAYRRGMTSLTPLDPGSLAIQTQGLGKRRLLLGLARPTSGTMRLLGRDLPGGSAEALARVGAIIEEPRFHPHLSGRENLHIHAAARDRAAHDRIDGAIARVGLAARADEKVKTYSLGMRQRLGVARCLLSDVTLGYRAEALELTIADSGDTPPRPTVAGHGLVGMRERAALFGGTLSAGPRDGRGFEVHASLPYDGAPVRAASVSSSPTTSR